MIIIYFADSLPKNKVNFAGRNSVGTAIRKTKTIPAYKKKLNNNDLKSNILIKY